MNSDCSECGNAFTVTIDEVTRFKEKQIPIPTRCKACRRSKLIEMKLKKLTKICFQILDKVGGGNHEPKLQAEQSQGNQPQA